jgi:hypothetical protein
MTNWGFEENEESNEGQGNEIDFNGPKALRDYAAQLKKQNDELNTKLTSFLEDQQKSKVQTVFENLGIPQAASVYQGPADPEKAKEWAESMRGIFGAGNQGGTPPVADGTPAVEPTLPASMQAQYQRMTEAGQEGTPTGNFEAAQASVGNASDINDIIAAFDRMNRM